MAILGASGRLGKLLAEEAMDNEFDVNALVVNPKEITLTRYELTIFEGNAETGEGLRDAIKGCPYVVSAIGSTKPIATQCMRNIIKVLEGSRSLKRFVYVSWVGAGDSQEQAIQTSGALPKINRALHPSMFSDITNAETVLRSTKLPYVILRPTRLTDGPRMDRVRTVPSDQPPPHRISRKDLARFIISKIEDPALTRQELTVGAVDP